MLGLLMSCQISTFNFSSSGQTYFNRPWKLLVKPRKEKDDENC
ncbi:hypothetical protein PENARI_c005G08565 [Penicillium arizonense]|uniref:Uncharacterized protein n=1 Tax=Penicillium arizonense TaxID=1835702 RepID=A0A1F5LQC9_PENAI|nr:hypothetical protein PENARI_c005G08565 [Penicillium arizonense]OGE55139.1 hypothetical protein PENARI_c005G08565 [Penicillium arizonense]